MSIVVGDDLSPSQVPVGRWQVDQAYYPYPVVDHHCVETGYHP